MAGLRNPVVDATHHSAGTAQVPSTPQLGDLFGHGMPGPPQGATNHHSLDWQPGLPTTSAVSDWQLDAHPMAGVDVPDAAFLDALQYPMPGWDLPFNAPATQGGQYVEPMGLTDANTAGPSAWETHLHAGEQFNRV